MVAFSEDFFRGREARWDRVAVGIAAEEVARGDPKVVLPALGRPVREESFADLTPEQSERWLPGVVEWERTVVLPSTEKHAGSDRGRLATRAAGRGDPHVLNGEKTSVSFLDADLFHVFARTDPEARGFEGV